VLKLSGILFGAIKSGHTTKYTLSIRQPKTLAPKFEKGKVKDRMEKCPSDRGF